MRSPSETRASSSAVSLLPMALLMISSAAAPALPPSAAPHIPSDPVGSLQHLINLDLACDAMLY